MILGVVADTYERGTPVEVIRGSDLLQKTVGQTDHVHQLLEPAVEVKKRIQTPMARGLFT